MSHGTRLFSYEDREEIARLTAALATRDKEIAGMRETVRMLHAADIDAIAALASHRHAALLAAGVRGGPGAWRWASDPTGTTLGDEAAWERLLGEMRDDSTIAHFAKQWEPPPAKRKPAAGWEKIEDREPDEDQQIYILRTDELTAYATSEGRWGIETTDDGTNGGQPVMLATTDYSEKDSLEAAQLAAEDALWAIADAINALRGGR